MAYLDEYLRCIITLHKRKLYALLNDMLKNLVLPVFMVTSLYCGIRQSIDYVTLNMNDQLSPS